MNRFQLLPQVLKTYQSEIYSARETIIHRPRLNVAYTKNYLYLIGKKESPMCYSCSSLQDSNQCYKTALQTTLKGNDEETTGPKNKQRCSTAPPSWALANS